MVAEMADKKVVRTEISWVEKGLMKVEKKVC